MKEIFKNIPGYEEMYQVSNLGRVKSLKRFAVIEDKILNPCVSGNGYKIVMLRKHRKGKAFSLHQLVAIAFLNHNPNRHEIVVDHLDSDKTNNNVNNLQLITNRENCSKDRKKGSSKYIGVSWSNARKKWIAAIQINGLDKNLGGYVNEIDAANAYQKALKEIEC